MRHFKLTGMILGLLAVLTGSGNGGEVVTRHEGALFDFHGVERVADQDFIIFAFRPPRGRMCFLRSWLVPLESAGAVMTRPFDYSIRVSEMEGPWRDARNPSLRVGSGQMVAFLSNQHTVHSLIAFPIDEMLASIEASQPDPGSASALRMKFRIYGYNVREGEARLSVERGNTYESVYLVVTRADGPWKLVAFEDSDDGAQLPLNPEVPLD